MDLINQLANERHSLYRLAAKQHLTVEQRARLNELSVQLPILWDNYRRELAAEKRYQLPRRSTERQAA